MANDTRGLAAVHSAATRYAHIVIKEPSTAEPKKAKRKRITPEQLKELTAVFACTDTPTHDVREELSKKLEMTNREVQVWFQNRRAKYNRLRIEQQRQIRNNTAIVYGAAMAAAAPQTHIAQPIYVYTEPVQPSEPRNQSQAQTQIQAPAPVSHEANSHSRLATRRNTLSSYPNLPLQTNMAPTVCFSGASSSSSNGGGGGGGDSCAGGHFIAEPHMQSSPSSPVSAHHYYSGPGIPQSQSPIPQSYLHYSHNYNYSPHQQHQNHYHYQHQSQNQNQHSSHHRHYHPYGRSRPSTWQSDVQQPAPSQTHQHGQAPLQYEKQPGFSSAETGYSHIPSSDLTINHPTKLPSIQFLLTQTSEPSGSASSTSASVSTSTPMSMPTALASASALVSTTSPLSAGATATLLADTGRYSHLQAATRVRSYTSPPDTQAESDHRPESPTQCQDLLMTEAKMGIDVLAAAAVSVSSAKSSTALMLPHLTPLAEFSMRTQAPSHQIDSSVPTSPHQPRESSPASRPEAERSTPSWRPW